MQGKQLEAAGASSLLSVSVQPADPSAVQAAQRARHMLATSKVWRMPPSDEQAWHCDGSLKILLTVS